MKAVITAVACLLHLGCATHVPQVERHAAIWPDRGHRGICIFAHVTGKRISPGQTVQIPADIGSARLGVQVANAFSRDIWFRGEVWRTESAALPRVTSRQMPAAADSREVFRLLRGTDFAQPDPGSHSSESMTTCRNSFDLAGSKSGPVHHVVLMEYFFRGDNRHYFVEVPFDIVIERTETEP